MPPNPWWWYVVGAMRRWPIRGGVAVVLVLVMWFFTSRWIAVAVDQIYTPRLAAVTSPSLAWNGIELRLGSGHFDRVVPNGDRLDLTGPGPGDREIAIVTIEADGRLVLQKDGQSFVFGRRAGAPRGGDDAMPIFAPEPGDAASAILDCSFLSWPAPFELNLMTGYTPSWQRYLYYRLSWQKPSGARLDILWRYRQDYDDANGWTGMMQKELMRIDIRPAPARL